MKVKNFIKDFVNNNKHIWIMSYWVIHCTWYLILQEITMARDPYPIVCDLDRAIPFCEWFILPYCAWFVDIVAVSLYLFFKNREGFVRLYVYLFTGMFICMLICTVIPMYFDRTGMEMYPRDNFLTDIVKLLQGFDEPTTVMPSMHVYVAIGLCVATLKDKVLGSLKFVKFCAVILCIGICLSIVFTKQHSVLDGIAAVALSVPVYFLAYGLKYKKLLKLVEKPCVIEV